MYSKKMVKCNKERKRERRDRADNKAEKRFQIEMNLNF